MEEEGTKERNGNRTGFPQKLFCKNSSKKVSGRGLTEKNYRPPETSWRDPSKPSHRPTTTGRLMIGRSFVDQES
jgi:hypothetical protein